MIAYLIIILNLILLEGLLSVDNAAVLATMVLKLPSHQQKKALRYGMLGAYLFRGIALMIASILVKWWWLKIAGGLFLIRLCVTHFTSAVDSPEETVDADSSGLFKWANRSLGLSYFWSMIILVEFIDMVFSVDNIFAAVAMSNVWWVILTGVFIGIACMRFVAGKFVDLMNKYPSLAGSAYVVIGLLGIKLTLAGIVSGMQWLYKNKSAFWNSVNSGLEWHYTDMIFSGCMMLVMFLPLLIKKKRL